MSPWYTFGSLAGPRLIAVNGGSRLIISDDGDIWTESTITDFAGMTGVAYSSSLKLWAVAGINGADTASIITSPDGTTWTQRSTPLDGAGWGGWDVAWSETLGLFMAVGENFGDGPYDVITSSDGINWTGYSSPLAGFAERIRAADFLGIFVIVGDGPPALITSTDGTSFNTPTIGVNPLYSAASSNTLAMVGGSFGTNGGGILTSTDGSTWTEIDDTAPLNADIEGLAYSSSLGRWVGVSDWGGGYNISSSDDDGVTWTGRDDTLNFCNDVCWSSELGLFVAVGNVGAGGETAMISSDGITWSVPSSNPISTGSLYQVAAR